MSNPFPGDLAGHNNVPDPFVTHAPGEEPNLPAGTISTPDMIVSLGEHYLDTHEDRHGRTVNVVALDPDHGRVEVQVIAHPRRPKAIGERSWISLKSLRDGYKAI